MSGDESRAVLAGRLRRVLTVLRPYLADLVLIGGWVPDLYRQYGALPGWTSELSFTSELDVLVSTDGVPTGDRPPLAVLLTEAGLRPIGDMVGAAVWAHADGGDAIEFLVPHRGPLRPSAGPVPVTGQPGVTAIMLPGVEFLGRHTTVLHVPGDDDILAVRVPRLGAYVINKGLIFPRRVPRSGLAFNPKRAKDLLYLRDLMAAGTAVSDVITRDIRVILDSDPVAQFMVDSVVSHLDFAVAGTFADDVDRAVAMLIEREPAHSRASARADILGHLVDALELLRPFRSPDPVPPDDD
ncbi:MAG TPA: hypothetical protein VNW46_08455 [Gemmatimonadaceae bacterium]|jgi:hypothetical protein|nr:hypothetical protein [Gemmatimonadaceae bacterium]